MRNATLKYFRREIFRDCTFSIIHFSWPLHSHSLQCNEHYYTYTSALRSASKSQAQIRRNNGQASLSLRCLFARNRSADFANQSEVKTTQSTFVVAPLCCVFKREFGRVRRGEIAPTSSAFLQVWGPSCFANGVRPLRFAVIDLVRCGEPRVCFLGSDQLRVCFLGSDHCCAWEHGRLEALGWSETEEHSVQALRHHFETSCQWQRYCAGQDRHLAVPSDESGTYFSFSRTQSFLKIDQNRSSHFTSCMRWSKDIKVV